MFSSLVIWYHFVACPKGTVQIATTVSLEITLSLALHGVGRLIQCHVCAGCDDFNYIKLNRSDA